MKKLSFLFAAFIAGMFANSFAGEYDPPDDIELVDLTTPTSGSVVGDSRPYSGYPAAKAFDGEKSGNSTRWLAYSPTETESTYITYKFNSATIVNSYRIWGGYGDRDFKNWTFQGSNDGTNWTVLDARTGQTAWNKNNSSVRFYRFVNKNAFLYYKFDCTANNGDNLTQTYEIEFYCVSSLTLGDCSVSHIEGSAFTVSAELSKDSATTISATATKDGESAPCVVKTLGTNVSVGTAVSGSIDGLIDGKTYVIGVSAENDNEATAVTLGSVFTGILTIEKIQDADEMTTQPAVIRVSRVAADPYDLEIRYSVSSETAVGGVHYVIPSGLVTIKAGETFADVELVPIYNRSLDSDASVSFIFATKDITFSPSDQSQSVTIVNCAYDITKRYVDATVIGGGQRAGTDWEDAYSSVVDAVDAVNLANLPAIIFMKPGTYETTAQLKLNGAIKIVGWTGSASDVVITNRTAYSNEDNSKDNRVVHMNDAAAGVYNVTLGGGGCSRNGSGGSSIYIGANGGVVSNCVVSCTRSGSYHNIGAVWLDGANALVTHTVVRNIEKYNVVDPNWGNSKWALGIHAKKGRVENCLVMNARSTCTITKNAANNSAGGIYAASGVKVVNCTFIDCHGTECGGIYADAGAEVVNCVVADSKPWQVIEGQYTKDNNIPVAGDPSAFVNCATDGDTAINDTCVIGTTSTFFTAYSDENLTPKAGGPLQNAGETPTGWAKGDGRLDLAGLTRFIGTAVDIGAYELQSAPQPRGMIIIYR